MRRFVMVAVGCLMLGVLLTAQQEAAIRIERPALVADPVPRVIKYSGTLKDTLGKTLSGIHAVNFLIYKDKQAGSALWMETQNVQADAAGNYSVLVGIASEK